MPRVEFDSLPESARVWVYGADRQLDENEERELLSAVDAFLDQWTAHGTPLSAARDWREGRFLTIAVDQEQAGASGCSIDGLFRTLKVLEGKLGARLVPSGLVYFRRRDGEIGALSRSEFAEAAGRGEIDDDTEVFDPSVTSLREWRGRFESHVADSWHKSLMAART
ncbi:MAG TPA: hypothetical protein VHM24_05190 [Gemmatimonadaceae bacterium]|nr:hypothetical protein [Gemmatimonadaceae bacterium]